MPILPAVRFVQASEGIASELFGRLWHIPSFHDGYYDAFSFY